MARVPARSERNSFLDQPRELKKDLENPPDEDPDGQTNHRLREMG